MTIIKIKSECYDILYDVSNLISYVLNPDKLENNIYGSRYLYLYDNPLYTTMKIQTTHIFISYLEQLIFTLERNIRTKKVCGLTCQKP